MSEIVLPELYLPPKPRIVSLGTVDWHLGRAAELLRAPLRDAPIRKRRLDWLRKEFDLLLMASGKSAASSQWVKNHLLGQVAITAIGTAYFALWTTAAATDMDAYVGNTAGEVSGGSYDRVSKTNNTTNFASITGDAAKVNSNAITFPTASANWNSGNPIPQCGVLDDNVAAGAGADFILWGDLTTARTVLNGDTAQFATSAFSWTEE